MSDSPSANGGGTDNSTGLAITFANLNKGVAESDVHIMFGGGPTATGTVYLHGTDPRPLAVDTDYTLDQLFGALQSDAGNYNQYAAYLSKITDAYSFPYTDKSAAPLLSINPGEADAITITILSD